MFKVEKDTFDRDALMIENGQVKEIFLADEHRVPYLSVRFDMPLAGIWSPIQRMLPLSVSNPGVAAVTPWILRESGKTGHMAIRRHGRGFLQRVYDFSEIKGGFYVQDSSGRGRSGDRLYHPGTAFRLRGYEVTCVEDFSQVMEEAFAQVEPQLVLMDISLPFYNGYHWCSQIRRVSKVPILFLSSASDNMNLIMAINMGGDDFLAKPFELTVLVAESQALLRRTYQFPGSQLFWNTGERS